MESSNSSTPQMETENKGKDKTITARILSSADISAMMTGTQNGLPIKVPTIPIKVVNPNTTQSSTIPGVLVATKPNSNNVNSTGTQVIRATNATNLILKGKTIPLVLEKSKVQPVPTSDTGQAAAAGQPPTVASGAANNSPKVPNILRGTSSPSKNTIDRQIVSHEATIELRKNILNKAALSPVPKENANINGNNQKQSAKVEKPIDLLQPIKPDSMDTDEAVDLSEINLRCETNELGAIEVKTMKMESEEESDQSGIDLMCKETLSHSPPNQPAAPVNSAAVNGIKKEPRKDEPKVRDDDILCCGGCGCYGMAGEFFSSEACCNSCHNRILQKNREKEKKERELAIQKQRREQRKKEQKEAKEKQQKQIKVEVSEDEDDEESDEDEDQDDGRLPFDSPHPWLDPIRGFSWSRYLECTNSRAAPTKLFQHAFPKIPNHFRVGQKLEAIDPDHNALICVASVARVQGHRILVHFDGYGKTYDFWENASSPNLFPVGWCEAHRQKLMPPPGYSMFTWRSYLESTKSQSAPKENFIHFYKPPKSSELNGWKIGLKLEAVDRYNNDLICVATVTNVMDGRVLIHFDGWDLEYDYWVTPHSPYIHPKGWCAERGIELNQPKGYRGDFSWDRYLEETRSKAVPAWAFKPPKNEQSLFKKGMKLEVVDKWNPIYVRVATVVDTQLRQVKIHFDGWPHSSYDFWIEDDSTDLHPTSWCAKTGHVLMPPLTVEEVSYYMAQDGCPTPGCRGLGHAKGYEFENHDNLNDCPYSPQNLNNDSMKPDRLKSMMVRRQSRSVSTDSDSIKIKTEPDDDELGRGNRKRKKRKFYDDDADADLIGFKQPFHPSLETLIRKDVFQPDSAQAQSQTTNGSSETLIDQNSAFLKPLTHTLSPKIVKEWSSKQVAEFVGQVPRLNCDIAALASKIIHEEVDGEAFLLMTQSDLVNMLGMKLGPAIKLFNALLLVKKQTS